MFNLNSINWKTKSLLFLVSQSISLFGSTLVQMAIIWYIALDTSSGFWVSALTISAYVPSFLISFIAGVWADKYSKKALIIGADSVIAIATLALFFIMPYLKTTTTMLSVILVISVIRSIGSGIQTPAVNAVIPQLVPTENLMRYNGINSTMQSIVQFAAPAAAGAILTFSAVRWTFLIDVGTAVVGIGLLLCVILPKQETTEQPVSMWQGLKTGFKYAFSSKLLSKLLITYGIFIFLCVPAGYLATLFVSRTYGDSYFYLTAVEVVGFLGMTIGGLLMGTWGGFKNRMKTLFIGMLCFGILAICMGVIPNFYAYLALMFIYGIALTMVQAATTTIIQEHADEDKQGSVFGILFAMYSGFLPIGMAVFGPLADIVNLKYIMIGSGALLVLLAVTLIINKTIYNQAQKIEVNKTENNIS